jgi:hypothetical protein
MTNAWLHKLIKRVVVPVHSSFRKADGGKWRLRSQEQSLPTVSGETREQCRPEPDKVVAGAGFVTHRLSLAA